MSWKNGMIIATVLTLGTMLVVGAGCKKDADQAGTTAASPPTGKHEAHHGGCLNAIETCAVGHAEIKVEGATFKCWFVSGENETGVAVRVPDKQITLAVTTKTGQPRNITLQAKPLELAGEKVGDCSYFEGKAAWLQGLEVFDATGTVNFKGAARTVKIEFPAGYDPD